MQERLMHIKERMKTQNIAVYYVLPNRSAEYMVDVDSAVDDILWMIAEIERLRVELNDLRSPRGTGPGSA